MNTITINNRQLPAVEYRGQRVVTLAMIDEVHQRPDGTAGRNFRENKSRLIEGEDYFELGSDEIRRHLPDGTFSKFAASGIVLVESGYLMLVKSFTVFEFRKHNRVVDATLLCTPAIIATRNGVLFMKSVLSGKSRDMLRAYKTVQREAKR